MPDLDEELLERVARWCADAGRTTAAAEIRRALGPLSWDELLAVRALLADAPPARPLGPFALADLARGVPADAAAERERDGRYPSLAGEPGAAQAAEEATAAPARPQRKKGARAPRAPGIIIRRARDAAPPAAPAAKAIPLVDELFLPEGRAVLERLVRRHGARRHTVLAAVAEGWRTPDGRPVDDDALTRLLDHHGLARAFARRERDELLHALRAAGGLRGGAAARLGLDRDGFDAALVRAGAGAEAEHIREARRAEVRAKATLAERVRLLLTEAARLEDLGLLAEVEDDLRRRLPEHVRAVAAAGGPILLALAQSLSVSPVEAGALAERLGVAVEGIAVAGADRAGAPRARPRSRFGAPGATGGMRPPRRPASGHAGPGPRPDRRGPPRAAGTSGPPRARREGAGFPSSRPRPERKEGDFGPPRERRGGSGFPSSRPRPERKEGGFGPPRERRGGSGFPSSRPRPERKEGGFGPPRERGAGGGGAPRERRGPGAGGGRPGRPGPRPGGPRGKPPPRGPRRKT